MTSKNVLEISSAIFLFILKLHATIPPNALTGSHDRAFLNDLSGEVSIDTPDGFACLIITVPVLFNES